MSEKLAVIKDTKELQQLFRSRVFIPLSDFSEAVDKDSLVLMSDFMDKHLAEGNSLYVQLISQVLILNPKSRKIFISKRLKGEPRLRGSISILFGGHVEHQDFYNEQSTSPLDNCARRELREELYIANKNLDIIPLGYVRDLRSNTSEHMGVIYLLITGSASVREKDIMQGKWISYDIFKKEYYGKLENWSKEVFDYLYENKKFNKQLKLQ